MMGVLAGIGEDTQQHSGDVCEDGGNATPAEVHWSHRSWERHEGLSPELWRKHGPTGYVISDFWLSKLGENKFLIQFSQGLLGS